MLESVSAALEAGRAIATGRAGVKFRRRRRSEEVRRIVLAVMRELPAGMTVGEIVAELARLERGSVAP
jgi:hypothetical protein